MAVVNKFNVNKQEVTLDAEIIENMSANDVSYNSSLQYDENTVGDKLSELEKKINGVEYSKSYSYNVGYRPSSSVAANPVIVDFKAPCTIEFGVKNVSFPDDIVNIILYLKDADGNTMNGNGTTLNNNNLVKFDAVNDVKYITMYSNNLFLKACTMTIVAKKVGDGLKQK